MRTILGFLIFFGVICLLCFLIIVFSGCAWDPVAYDRALPVGQAIQQASAQYAAAVSYQPQYIPTPVYVQPSVIPPNNIDTGFHPAPPIR